MTENGRSMVEMLGVLAIIGVLSAGALAGYSKAMFRHRINQSIDIYNTVLQNLAELDEKDWGTTDWIESTEEIRQYGILPECQKTTNMIEAESGCRLPIGDLEIEVINDEYMSGILWLHLTDAKSCVAFASAGWERVVPIDWWNPLGAIAIESHSESVRFNTPSEIEMQKIVNACNLACAEGYCLYTIIIRDW